MELLVVSCMVESLHLFHFSDQSSNWLKHAVSIECVCSSCNKPTCDQTGDDERQHQHLQHPH